MDFSLLRFRKKQKLSPRQEKRVIARAKKRTENLPASWRAMAFHSEIHMLAGRKRARIAMRKTKVLGFRKRRQVLRLIDVFDGQINTLEQKALGQEFERAREKELDILEEGMTLVLGNKAHNFLNLFFRIKF